MATPFSKLLTSIPGLKNLARTPGIVPPDSLGGDIVPGPTQSPQRPRFPAFPEYQPRYTPREKPSGFAGVLSAVIPHLQDILEARGTGQYTGRFVGRSEDEARMEEALARQEDDRRRTHELEKFRYAAGMPTRKLNLEIQEAALADMPEKRAMAQEAHALRQALGQMTLREREAVINALEPESDADGDPALGEPMDQQQVKNAEVIREELARDFTQAARIHPSEILGVDAIAGITPRLVEQFRKTRNKINDEFNRGAITEVQRDTLEQAALAAYEAAREDVLEEHSPKSEEEAAIERLPKFLRTGAQALRAATGPSRKAMGWLREKLTP